jgi:DNA polymerase III epsilon subunit-like protein
MDNENYLILDTETTGLHCRFNNENVMRNADGLYDEILQLAVINAMGQTLFYDSFKPVEKRIWPQAQKVHGISPHDVKDKTSFESRRNEIQSIIDASELVVAYNAEFDLGFLSAQGIELQGKPYICLMKEFARIYGRKKVHDRGYTFQSLDACARYYEVQNPKAHNALADAQTTLHCYQAFVKSAGRPVYRREWGVC